MALKPIRYPFDKTGTSPDNLVTNEIHELKPTKVRVFAPTYGGFFTESFVLRDVGTGQILRRGDQYKFDNLFEMASIQTKKECAGIIVILDATVSNRVSCDYQVVGGLYGQSNQAIIQQIEALGLDNRPVEWGNIFNKPANFAPAKHLHDIGDAYGFEYMVHAINQLRFAILIGDEGSHTAIHERIDAVSDKFSAKINEAVNGLNSHVTNYNNPHRVTAAQVGAYTTGEVDDKVGALSTKLTALINNRNNPHGVTAGQVGAYTREQVDGFVATIRANIGSVVDTHVKDFNNPHRVTAAQIGAYTKAEIDTKVRVIENKLSDHETNYDNPHRVTASQVDAYTKDEAISKTNELIGSKLDLSEDGKISPDKIKVSAQPGNLITTKTDGLYFGLLVSELFSDLYVDAIAGVDEAITVDNGRGTKDKPLKTIAFALTQGPDNIKRTIYIKEKQTHSVGKVLESFNSQNYTQTTTGDLCIVRGGEVMIRPYGPEGARASGGLNDIWVYDYYTTKIRNFMPVISLKGSEVVKRGDQNITVEALFGPSNASFIYSGYSFKFDLPSTLKFMNVHLVHERMTDKQRSVINNPKCLGVMNSGLFDYSSASSAVIALGCAITLDRPSGPSNALFSLADSIMKHRVHIESTYFDGDTENNLITSREENGRRGLLFSGISPIISEITLLQDNPSLSKINKLFSNPRHKDGEWLDFSANFKPPKEGGNIVWRNGKLYITAMENGAPKEVQVFPARWADM